MEALEQIALQMPAIDGFLNHFPLLIVPHGIVQHILQHTQRPQFSDTHMAQIGTVVAAVGAPVFLLPTGVGPEFGGSTRPVGPGPPRHHPRSNRPGSCHHISGPPRRWRYTPGTDTQYPPQRKRGLYRKYGSSCHSSHRQRHPRTPQKRLFPEGWGDTGRWAGPAGPAAPSLSASPPAFWVWGGRNDCPSFPHIPSACPAA